MATTETLSSVKCVCKLEDGETASGSIRTVNVNLGTLSPSSWDADKAMRIAGALTNVFSKTIYSVVKSTDAVLEDE